MITDLLIDVDGTLVDTKNIFFVSLNETLRKFGQPETDDPALFGMSVDQVLKKLKIHMIDGIKEEWERNFGNKSTAAGFYPKIALMMKILSESGIRIYVITSRNHSTVDSICENSELSPYIIGCIAAEDTERHKPDPAPILKAVEKFELRQESVIYIGDTYQDYQASAAANIRFAFAGWNTDAERRDYELIFDDPLEAAYMIERENNERYKSE